jgi:AcrR family transcriptional regulator
MPRIPRQKRAKATVEAIVEAGFRAVAEHGEAGTTTNHIAKIAGISVGTLYEYFANKEAIYAAMQARMLRDAIAAIEPLTNDVIQLDIRAAVVSMLQQVEAFLLDHDGRYLSYARHALNVSPKLQLAPLIRLLDEILLRYVMQHPKYMRLPNIPTMSYIVINGGVFTVLRHLSDPNPPITFAQLSEGLAELVSHYASNELATVEPQEA